MPQKSDAARRPIAKNEASSPCILGLDPGLHRTGYAVMRIAPRLLLIEAGVIRILPRPELSQRLNDLYNQISDILKEFSISAVGVEQLYAHYLHPRTAILMGHARGVILLAAGRHGAPVTDLPSTLVKKTFTGNGHATKLQIQRSAASRFQLAKLPSPPDVADAMAIGYTLAAQLRPGRRL